jgi:putative two-component system response regulator
VSYVLIVEDQAPIVRLLKRWVEDEGERVVAAESAEQALVLAAEQPPAVALCDINLPRGRDGFWLVEQLHRLCPTTATVMTTGLQRFDAAVTGLHRGVVDYVVKPYSRARIVDALRRALAEHESRKARQAAAAEDVGGASAGATAALLTVLQAQGGGALALAQRVAARAAQLATALGLGAQEVACIEHAALLSQVDRLDVHVLARRVPLLGAANAIALAARERFDGTGFPLGLQGGAIPPGARILAVALAYEELVGPRLDAMTPPVAVAVLCGARAREFDPVALGALRSQLRPPVDALSA